MIDLNQQDLNVRLQLTNCCVGEKTVNLLAKVKIGSKDVDCKLQELQVLQEMLKYLKCYDVNAVDVLATGTVEINVIPAGSTINVLVNGISISGLYTRTSAIQSTEMINLTAQINAFQSFYMAVFDPLQGAFGKIVITSKICNSQLLQATIVNATVTLNGLTGICSANCLTEIQAQAMFDWISKKCDTCFKSPGFSYI